MTYNWQPGTIVVPNSVKWSDYVEVNVRDHVHGNPIGVATTGGDAGDLVEVVIGGRIVSAEVAPVEALDEVYPWVS